MSDTHSPDPITDPARLAALRDTGLLDTPVEDDFERITALAAELLHAPTALLSLVDTDRQFFKSAVGLDAPWSTARQTGLDMSVCQHVVRSGSVVAIADTREDARVRESHKIADAGIVAYAGAPVATAEGHTLGSLCVIDSAPRQWQAAELELLATLATRASALLAQRATSSVPPPGQVGGDASTAASTEAAAAAVAGADRVWEAADELLGALDDYDALIQLSDARVRVGQQEREARARVDAAQRALLSAAEAFGAADAASLGQLSATVGTAARALWLAALYYAEREAFRQRASAQFQMEGGALDAFERAALLVRTAQSELERTAAAYRHARLERRTRAR